MAREPSGPIAMGNPVADDNPAFARTNPTAKLTPRPRAGDRRRRRRTRPTTTSPAIRGGAPACGRRAPALALLGAGGYLAAYKRDARARAVRAQDARAEEAYRQGREYFLLDSDDAFRNAAAAYERAHEADDKSALPLAASPRR